MRCALSRVTWFAAVPKSFELAKSDNGHRVAFRTGRSSGITVVAIAVVALLHPCHGSNRLCASDDPVADAASIEPSTLDQLSAGDFLLRGRSTQELWQDRSRHRSAVLQATRSSDLELASRANWVLQRWQRGITPSTPSELWPALESSEPMTAIEILLGAERFSEALVAIEESLGTMESIAITTQLNRLITEKFPIYVRAASRGDHLESLIA
ncbi:MAG: hypothetical protein AAF745_08950, partial [Planctomycetota bacterium]